MRSYLFTDRERGSLILWLGSGEENQTLRDLFTKIRVNMTSIREDLELMNRVMRRLQKERRFHGRMSKKMILGKRRR